jgi:hypothetical protein
MRPPCGDATVRVVSPPYARHRRAGSLDNMMPALRGPQPPGWVAACRARAWGPASRLLLRQRLFEPRDERAIKSRAHRQAGAPATVERAQCVSTSQRTSRGIESSRSRGSRCDRSIHSEDRSHCVPERPGQIVRCPLLASWCPQCCGTCTHSPSPCSQHSSVCRAARTPARGPGQARGTAEPLRRMVCEPRAPAHDSCSACRATHGGGGSGRMPVE